MNSIISSEYINEFFELVLKSKKSSINLGDYEDLKDFVDGLEYTDLANNTKEDISKCETIQDYYFSIVDTMETYRNALLN